MEKAGLKYESSASEEEDDQKISEEEKLRNEIVDLRQKII